MMRRIFWTRGKPALHRAGTQRRNFALMFASVHSLPMHSAPVPANVRYTPDRCGKPVYAKLT